MANVLAFAAGSFQVSVLAPLTPRRNIPRRSGKLKSLVEPEIPEPQFVLIVWKSRGYFALLIGRPSQRSHPFGSASPPKAVIVPDGLKISSIKARTSGLSFSSVIEPLATLAAVIVPFAIWEPCKLWASIFDPRIIPLVG